MHVHRTLCGTVRTFFPVWLGLLFLGLLLKNPSLAADGVRRGLSLAAKTVIPSLFPSMLLSEWLMGAGAGRMRFPFLERVGCFFSLSSSGMLCILLGILCGSPVGARCASSAYSRGEITQKEYERLLPLASIPSPAFLIGTVGVALLRNYRLGILLYVCTLLAALTAGALQKKEKEPKAIPHQILQSPSDTPLGGIALLVRSVRSATEGVLSVSAYILLFGTLCDVLCCGVGATLPPTARTILLSALEMCGGMQSVSEMKDAVWMPFLIGGAAGWCGLSVHVQVMSAGANDGISYRTYINGKLLQALICAILFATVSFFA